MASFTSFVNEEFLPHADLNDSFLKNGVILGFQCTVSRYFSLKVMSLCNFSIIIQGRWSWVRRVRICAPNVWNISKKIWGLRTQYLSLILCIAHPILDCFHRHCCFGMHETIVHLQLTFHVQIYLTDITVFNGS